MLYYSSPNCSINIKAEGIDTFLEVNHAYALSIDKTSSVMPYYNWADRKLTNYINGTIIAQGMLILNIGDESYLKGLLQGKYVYKQEDESKYLDDIERELKIATSIMEKRITPTDNQDNINLSVNVEDLIKLAELKREHLRKVNKKNNPTTTSNNNVFDTECNIEINAGSITNTIEGIRFTGKSFKIEAGSSQNIKFAYPFIAKDTY